MPPKPLRLVMCDPLLFVCFRERLRLPHKPRAKKRLRVRHQPKATRKNPPKVTANRRLPRRPLTPSQRAGGVSGCPTTFRPTEWASRKRCRKVWPRKTCPRGPKLSAKSCCSLISIRYELNSWQVSDIYHAICFYSMLGYILPVTVCTSKAVKDMPNTIS